MRAAVAFFALLAACEKPAPRPAPDAAPVEATRPRQAPTRWPYVAWDRAEAVSFNQFAPRRGVPLRVVDETGWSPHVAERVAIAREQAHRALELLAVTEGELITSKCPFPRHAIVFFAGDTAIASANVGLECGDILTWPAWRDVANPEPVRFAAYLASFPQWEAFFGAIQWSAGPT